MLSGKPSSVCSFVVFLLASALGSSLPASEGTVSKGFSQQETVIAGSPHDSMEVRHLVLTGTNEEIGRALAQLARERYQVKPQPSADPLRMRAQRQYIESTYPILYERMRGVAAAYDQRVDDDSLDHTALGYFDLRAGCSIVYLPPRLTTTGTGVVSRDYDYSTGSITFGFLEPGKLHPTARPYLLELHPDHGYASLAMVAYDLLSGVCDGMNSEGLTVTMAMDDELFTKYPMEPTIAAGVGMGELQTLRLILDTCATADEAKRTLLQTKQYYQFVPVHYLIADRFGNSFVWEYSQAHNKEFIVENPNQPLVMTNFSLNRHFDQNRPPAADQVRNVCSRYCLLTEQLAAAPGKISEDFIRQTHKKVDAELPASADTSRPPIRTFWHALYYPEERRMKVSFYLHDEPGPLQGNRVRVARSEYLEFRLAPTNIGKGASPPAVETPKAKNEQNETARAPVSDGTTSAIADELKAGGALLKVDGGRVVTVDLSKAADPAPLLPLLRKLPDLAELNVGNRKIDDAAMEMLAGLPKLARLGLYSSSVGDEGLKVLKTLPGLRLLAAGGTKITDAGLAQIKDLPLLESLGLRGDNITDAGLQNLATLTNLNTLNLAETKVTDAGLAYLKDLTRLEVLTLTSDAITDAGLAQLASHTNIAGLFLGATKVTDAGLVYLRGMTKLTKLNLARTAVTDEGVAEAKKHLPFWANILRDQP